MSRRSAITGLAALTAVLTAGCTGASPRPAAAPTPGAAGSGSATPAATVLPDVSLAATVLRGEQALLDQVRATVRRHPGLHTRLARTRATHRAHTALLTRAVPRSARSAAGATPPPRRRPVPDQPGPALAALARAEARLSQAGVEHSLQARSGAFARVLGSMAAAAAQQSTVLAAAAATAEHR
jgi:hypothetical protein